MKQKSLSLALATILFTHTVQPVCGSTGAKPATIVVLQDAHLHPEAQASIADIINEMGQKAEADGSQLVVGLEGASTASIDFSRTDSLPFRRHPHRKTSSQDRA
jgi:hypothetical protein